jgi:hypothetical protein
MTIQTTKELFEAISEGVRADPATLRKVMLFRWNNLYFRVEKTAAPLDEFSIIFCIFQDEREYRFYTLAAKPPEPLPANWKTQAPQLFTLVKGSSDYTVEAMPLETMADLLIEEWNAIADGVNAADYELELVLEHVESLSAGGSMVNSALLLESLRNEEHREEGDDSDPETETEPDASAAPAVPTDAPAQEATPQ